MACLQTFYSPADGQWNSVGWWNAANARNTVTWVDESVVAVSPR
jgi:hypothetical protein